MAEPYLSLPYTADVICQAQSLVRPWARSLHPRWELPALHGGPGQPAGGRGGVWLLHMLLLALRGLAGAQSEVCIRAWSLRCMASRRLVYLGGHIAAPFFVLEKDSRYGWLCDGEGSLQSDASRRRGCGQILARRSRSDS